MHSKAFRPQILKAEIPFGIIGGSLIGEAGQLAEEAPRFYRGIKEAVASVEDFESNAARGFPPRGAEVRLPKIYSGISVFDSLETARQRLRVVSKVSHIAEVVVKGVGEIEQTLGPGHYTWWVDPAEAVNTVIRVFSK
jgi:hypothetical protein